MGKDVMQLTGEILKNVLQTIKDSKSRLGEEILKEYNKNYPEVTLEKADFDAAVTVLARSKNVISSFQNQNKGGILVTTQGERFLETDTTNGEALARFIKPGSPALVK